MRFHSLKYQDGSQRLIQPPPTLAKVGDRLVFLWQQVRHLHQTLLFQVAKTNDAQYWWPISGADERCFGAFRSYYGAIAQLMGISSVETLTPESRHEFFVCTAPESQRLGLSHLEQLMQVQEPSEEDLSTPEGLVDPISTSGDSVIDALVMSALVFKRNGLAIAQLLPPGELTKAVIFAIDKSTPPDDDDKASRKRTSRNTRPAPPLPTADTDPAYQSQKSAIAQKLKSMGVSLPNSLK